MDTLNLTLKTERYILNFMVSRSYKKAAFDPT
jgi:hypothetical protein